MLYDETVARVYDGHFQRPVDRWEDERLVRLLRPHVNGRTVIDVGCGTGWTLDHLAVYDYLGVDASRQMLARLIEKHPGRKVRLLEVGSPEWDQYVMSQCRAFDVAVSTWAAHDLGDLGRLVAQLAHVAPTVILHGQGPRYERRHHYVLDGIDGRREFRQFTVSALRDAAEAAGLRLRWLKGTGALPDRLARNHATWKAAAALPARWHYAYAACMERQ